MNNLLKRLLTSFVAVTAVLGGITLGLRAIDDQTNKAVDGSTGLYTLGLGTYPGSGLR